MPRICERTFLPFSAQTPTSCVFIRLAVLNVVFEFFLSCHCKGVNFAYLLASFVQYSYFSIAFFYVFSFSLPCLQAAVSRRRSHQNSRYCVDNCGLLHKLSIDQLGKYCAEKQCENDSSCGSHKYTQEYRQRPSGCVFACSHFPTPFPTPYSHP